MNDDQRTLLSVGLKRRVWKHPPASLGKAISDFFSLHYGMLDVNVYGAHRVGKHGVARSGERLIVFIMTADTKRRIILENSYVYLKGTQCF